MRNLYIGSGPRKKNNSTLKWKIYTFLFLFLALVGAGLKVAGPTIVEKWLNQQGEGNKGYAFSIRDVELSFEKGQITLTDVKVFNPKTSTELIKAPQLTVQVNLQDLIQTQEKLVTVVAEKMDVILSKDFSSELERITNSDYKHDLYLDAVEGRIGQLNIIEQKESESRSVLELNEVNLKVKNISVNSINKKTEFSVSSKIAEGGKFNLTGKTGEEKSWTINGSLKQVPAGIFNKIAGDKLPFSFIEPSLSAEITAHSENGKVAGEISPEIRKVNLIVEKPGIPTQVIARMLSEDLTFTLPFTLKDGLAFQYSDTYSKLKMYRKYPQETASVETQAAAKKSVSFWPF